MIVFLLEYGESIHRGRISGHSKAGIITASISSEMGFGVGGGSVVKIGWRPWIA